MLNGIVPWYGAKRKKELAGPILDAIGRPTTLIDPACGSMAIPLAVRAKLTIVNDLHLRLWNLGRVLQDDDMAHDLYRWCGRTLFHEAEGCLSAQECEGDFPQDTKPADMLNMAQRFLYLSWAMMNGFAGSDQTPRFNMRWDCGGGDPAKRWQSVAESIPEWHRILRDWTITNRDMFDVIAAAPDRDDTCLYVDPPYHSSSRSGPRYTHDFEEAALFGQDDHVRLQDALSRFTQSRVVISYYDCPEIRDIYHDPRWTIIKNTQEKNIASASGGESVAPEIIIVNKSP